MSQADPETSQYDPKYVHNDAKAASGVTVVRDCATEGP